MMKNSPPPQHSRGPLSTAVICVWNDIDPEIESEYEAWYQWDHLPDRIGIPGFKSCRRFVRVAGEGRQYFTFSDLESLEVSRSPAYVARLKEVTDWTHRIMPHFRRAIRFAADVTIDRGDGTGAFLATALYENLSEETRKTARGAIEAALDGVMKDPCVTRVRVFELNRAASDVPNPEAKLRPDPQRTSDLTILVEGSYEAAVWANLAKLRTLPELAPLSDVMPPTAYRLLYSSRA